MLMSIPSSELIHIKIIAFFSAIANFTSAAGHFEFTGFTIRYCQIEV